MLLACNDYQTGGHYITQSILTVRTPLSQIATVCSAQNEKSFSKVKKKILCSVGQTCSLIGSYMAIYSRINFFHFPVVKKCV